MTFEEALDHPGPLLAAWDLTPVLGERTLSLYSLADDRATALAHDSAPVGDEDAASAPLRARGIPIGECDRGCEFVWISGADGVAVWGPHWHVLDARGATLTLADGRTLSPNQIERVFAYASDDYIERGVCARLPSGEEVSLVRDVSAVAAADPRTAATNCCGIRSGRAPSPAP
ncbi:MAG TPA: hypothetical protein VGB66_19700 [Longimicrobium sp.]|jgi:hypothetical protein